jgi:hypothetical protein
LSREHTFDISITTAKIHFRQFRRAAFWLLNSETHKLKHTEKRKTMENTSYLNEIKKAYNNAITDQNKTFTESFEFFKSSGYLATQYEKYGAVTTDDVIECLFNEYSDFVENPLDFIGEYTEYLLDTNQSDYILYDSIDEILDFYPCDSYESKISMLKDFMFSSNFSFMDDYFYFDGYGHVVSCTEKKAAERIKNDKEFTDKLKSDFIESNYTDYDIKLVKDIANIYVKHGY